MTRFHSALACAAALFVSTLVTPGLQAQTAPSATPVVASPKAATAPTKPTTPSSPRWSDLKSSQQQALQPLNAVWPQLSEGQKRKWITLAHNFHALPDSEQQKLQNRMLDWAGLSAQERTQARLNFAAAARISTDDKKAQWEAYQALSEEEKKQLAAKAYRAPGAAQAIRPAATQKLAVVPMTPGNATSPRKIVPAAPSGEKAALPTTDRRESTQAPAATAVPASASSLATAPSTEGTTEMQAN